MHQAISHALEAICLERDNQQYATSFDAVHALVGEFGEQGLAERIFDEIPRTIPYELVADLFNFLIWQTEDNGGAIGETTERWLIEGTDNRKLLIALNLEIYPFTDDKEMERVLSRLAETNVRVYGRCKELIRSRKKLGDVG